MHISDITVTRHFFGRHRAISFESRDELIAAIRALGSMLAQDEAQVESLIKRLLADIDNGMARSGLAASLMGSASEPAGPVVGPVSLAENGWVVGARFSEHNTYGLPQRPPFMGYSLRISQDVTDARLYSLVVTDKLNWGALDPTTNVGTNYTESVLAAQLGRPRPMSLVQVYAFYEQDGPEVDFGLVPLLDALGSINGLAKALASPEEIAQGYFKHLRDENFSDWSFQLRLEHTNGCSVSLDGFSGIQPRTNTIGRELLVRREGSRLVGPYDPTYRPVPPFAMFGVTPPQYDGPESDYQAVAANNRLATDLAHTLSTALWNVD